jgi:hypothetical protein
MASFLLSIFWATFHQGNSLAKFYLWAYGVIDFIAAMNGTKNP